MEAAEGKAKQEIKDIPKYIISKLGLNRDPLEGKPHQTKFLYCFWTICSLVQALGVSHVIIDDFFSVICYFAFLCYNFDSLQFSGTFIDPHHENI